MRVVKQADVRKNEILDAADALFAEKGFDGASTDDILKAVGIARGTLYHHFKSKEDIMDALIERYAARLLSGAQAIAGDKSVPVEERMMRTILALRVEHYSETGGKEMIGHLHKPQNALMHQKIQRVMMHGIPPILAGILEEGIAQGLFYTPYPLECMEMTVAYLDTVFDNAMFELADDQRILRIEAFIFHLEKMLSAPAGRFAYVAQMFENGHGAG